MEEGGARPPAAAATLSSCRAAAAVTANAAQCLPTACCESKRAAPHMLPFCVCQADTGSIALCSLYAAHSLTVPAVRRLGIGLRVSAKFPLFEMKVHS